jgi:uncharacterized protein YbjT (DUF2867 family)
MPHLLIIGANGVLGNAAAKFFLQKGYTVSAFVRNKEKAAVLEKEGARIIIGDITDPASIKNIFTGVDVVLAAVHALLGRGRNSSQNVDDKAHRNIIDEAAKNGVRHFIYNSVCNASPDNPIDFIRTKYSIEQYLTKSKMSYTILRLPAFMEWHAYNLVGKSIVEKGKTKIFGKGTNPANFIAVKDVVAVLDKIMLNENYYNKIIPLAGPANFSRNEVAEHFGRALSIKPAISHVPAGMLKVLSVVFRPFHPGLSRIMKFTLYNERTPETANVKDNISQFGLTPTTLDDFIRAVIVKR